MKKIIIISVLILFVCVCGFFVYKFMKKKKMVNDILDFDDERNELSGQGAKRTAEERKKLFDDYMKKDFDTIKKSWDSVQKDRAKMIEAKAKAMAKLQQKAA